MRKKRPSMENVIREIAATFAKTRSPTEIYDVLHALLSPSEREGIALRWRLVQLLLRGMSQRKISAKLGVSLCKITRGARELKIGRRGFRKVLLRTIPHVRKATHVRKCR